MRLAGRIVLLTLGLWLLAQTALVPVFVSPQVNDLRLRSEREGAPHNLSALQAVLLMADLDRRTHQEWQVVAGRLLAAASLLAVLFCGAMAAASGAHWLRWRVDSHVHIRRFGLTLSGWTVVVLLLLTHLVAHSAQGDVRYLGLGVCGWISLAAGLTIALIHNRLEPQV